MYAAVARGAPAHRRGEGRGLRDTEWRRVDIAGEVRSIFGVNSEEPPPHLLAAGESDGEPLLVDITEGVSSTVEGELPDENGEGLDWVHSNGLSIAVTERADPGASEPARLSIRDDAETLWREVPQDARGRRAAWVAPLLDSEENWRAAGAVSVGDEWQLHAWQAGEHWRLLDREGELFVAGTPGPQTVLAATTETSVAVAGAVSGRRSGGGVPQVWSISDDLDGGPRRWERHPMASTPDELTDIAEWALGWWVAGHRRYRPVVYDFDEGNGRALPVPATRLDPEHPAVFIARVPISASLVLATQSVDGPAVWIAEGRRWVRLPAPPGRLMAAEEVGGGVYLLVDGAVWYRKLPGAGRA